MCVTLQLNEATAGTWLFLQLHKTTFLATRRDGDGSVPRNNRITSFQTLSAKWKCFRQMWREQRSFYKSSFFIIPAFVVTYLLLHISRSWYIDSVSWILKCLFFLPLVVGTSIVIQPENSIDQLYNFQGELKNNIHHKVLSSIITSLIISFFRNLVKIKSFDNVDEVV